MMTQALSTNTNTQNNRLKEIASKMTLSEAQELISYQISDLKQQSDSIDLQLFERKAKIAIANLKSLSDLHKESVKKLAYLKEKLKEDLLTESLEQIIKKYEPYVECSGNTFPHSGFSLEEGILQKKEKLKSFLDASYGFRKKLREYYKNRLGETIEALENLKEKVAIYPDLNKAFFFSTAAKYKLALEKQS